MNGRNALPIPPASPERQLKLEQFAQESANLTLRDVRCPRCNTKIYGNTAQKKVPDTAKCDIINLWINR